MICRKCPNVMRHRLKQTGLENPQSYICVVCSTLHDDNGNLFDPNKPRGQNTLITSCPNCGSTEIIKQVMMGSFFCRKCRQHFN